MTHLQGRTYAETIICNGCLELVDVAWEPVVPVGEFAFHQRCAPVCCVCGKQLERPLGNGTTDCVVLESEVRFVPPRGYQVRLKVCCCSECYELALHDEPAALA
jgi:hypothetical protein